MYQTTTVIGYTKINIVNNVSALATEYQNGTKEEHGFLQRRRTPAGQEQRLPRTEPEQRPYGQ